MKTLLKTTLLSLTVISMLGFKVGDEIELDQFINARTNPNFTKQAKNIKTTLAKGTTGKVADLKRFHSGNYGIKMAITSGPNAGQSYWVYYNKENPGILLSSTKTKKEIQPQEIEPDKLEEKDAPKTELLEDKIGLREPQEQALDLTLDDTLSFQDKINNLLRVPASTECDNFIEKPQTESVDEDIPTPEPIFQQKVDDESPQTSGYVMPERLRPESSPESKRCRGTGQSYDICYDGSPEKLEAVKIQNYGPNNIVKTNEYYINRSYEFEFPDRASSDIKLFIVDSPDDRTSHTTYNIMLFFPRTVQPTVEKVGNELIVTLPNKEIIKYNATTKEIIGGVLSEEPMAQAPGGKAVPAKVKYNGSNVTIRASKTGDLPYGDIELKNGQSAPSTTIATVSKKGHKDCKIPSKDIWYNDKKIKDILIKPELATDEGLDRFIKQRCGFSLF